MRAVRSINNNIAVCIDSAGAELIAMGKGIGYGKMPHDVDLAAVTHTYYSVDERQLGGIRDLPQEVLEFAAAEIDRMSGQLAYQLSPNYVFTLADHIVFAIKRARQHINVRMPLSYDVAQNYPVEYRIGRQMVRRVRRSLGVALSDDEATGIAMGIVNARMTDATELEAENSQCDEDMLEDLTDIVESHFNVTIDRSSFSYSRYATHMFYLFRRIHGGETLAAEGLEGFQGMDRQFPEGVACVEKIAAHLKATWDATLTDEEKLYLVIHVSRICIKGTGR